MTAADLRSALCAASAMLINAANAARHENKHDEYDRFRGQSTMLATLAWHLTTEFKL